MKKYVYAVGDIHGEFELMQKALRAYDPAWHQLVFLGDLNDRGKQTKECWLLAQQLVEEQQAVFLMGNHEMYFLEFLLAPEDWAPSYFRNGGKETMESLLHHGATAEYSPTEMAMMIRSRYPELLAFLEARPLYLEWEKYIFVHAGVDLTKQDWHETSAHDFLWIRDAFFQGENKTGKTIVFGHTITPVLHGDMQTTDLWCQDNKIGMDGGAVFGGSLHAVIFDAKGLVQDIEYQQLKAPWQPEN